jgi:ABC-type glycerol-3-phosphate transport system permease component
MKKSIIFVLGLSVFISIIYIISGITSGANIVDSDPENGAENVPVDTWITFRFNTSMDPDTVTVEIRPYLEPYGFRTEWRNDDTELIIKLNASLTYSRNYTASIEGEDVDGNPLDGSKYIYFQTESDTETIKGISWENTNSFIMLIILITLGIVIGILLGYNLARKRIKE